MKTRPSPIHFSRHRRSIVLMLVSTVCFTANVLLIRALGQLQTVNVWLIAWARFAVGLGLVVTFFRREFRPGHLFRNRLLAERGLVGGIAIYGFYLTVLKIGAGRATFINSTYVIWGGLMAASALGERFRPSLAAGGIASLAGLALLTRPFGGGSHAGFYDLVAMLAAFASAHVVVVIRRLHAREHTATIFAAQCVYGLLICSAPAALHLQPLSAAIWGVILLASVCAGAGQLTMTRAFRDLPVAEGSLLQMLVPVGIAAGGMVFFGERFTPVEMAGAALILAGSLLPAVWRERVPLTG